MSAATFDQRPLTDLWIGWTVAIALHLGLFMIGAYGERPTVDQKANYVPVDVVEIEPQKTPPPAPEVKQEPKPNPPPKKIDKVVDLTKKPPKESSTPPPTDSAPDASANAKPVFGLNSKSFGKTGGFKVRTGNTVGIRPEDSAMADKIEALRPVPSYQVTSLPSIKSQPKPAYPPALRSAGIEGDVILELLIDADGNVADAAVVESTNKEFEKSALASAYQLTFSPAMQGKTAVAVKIRFPVKFRLR